VRSAKQNAHRVSGSKKAGVAALKRAADAGFFIGRELWTGSFPAMGEEVIIVPPSALWF
jgi:hypothetical protein